jgi:hypothetical protein
MCRYHQIVLFFFLFCLVLAILSGCAPAVIVKAPPSPKVETRPPQPFQKAVWIEGYWKWSSAADDFIWTSGHWEKAKPGKNWVESHWKRTPKGWVWVKGHWK